MKNSFVVMTDPAFGSSDVEEEKYIRDRFQQRTKDFCKGYDHLFLMGDLIGPVVTEGADLGKEELERRMMRAYENMIKAFDETRKSGLLPDHTAFLSDTNLTKRLPDRLRFDYSVMMVGKD